MKKILLIILNLFIVSCSKTKIVNETKYSYKDYACLIDLYEIKKEILLNKYNSRYAINNDYIGEIRIGNNLINEYIVQSDDNEFYLENDFNKNYYSSGSVFMDFENKLGDQNLILYGHYVYKDETIMFSPLHILKNKDNYEENKYIEIDFKDYTKKYIVSNVFYYDLGNENLEYYYPNYNNFNEYYNNVKKIDFYDSGVEIKSDDKFITLQTCVRNRDDLRLIVLAKEIE